MRLHVKRVLPGTLFQMSFGYSSQQIIKGRPMHVFIGGLNSIRKGEKVMNYIELNSNGTAVDENGITHPIFADGTIDMDE